MREVVLKIKSASHRLEDLEIPTDLSVTVKELKKVIQVQNPIHPDIGDQRLIYAGHLLEDSQTLEEVLLPNSEAAQSSFTLHLACTSSFFQPQRQQPPRQNAHEPVNNISKGPVILPTTTPPSARPNVSATGIPAEYINMHQQYLNQMMTYMTEWSQGRPYSFNWSTNNPNYATAESFYSNTADGLFRTFTDGSATTARTVGGNTPEVEIHVTAEIERIAEVAQAQEAARAAAEAVRLENAAQVAAAREDDDPPRDVIDWMYTFSRVALIFSVVYFYSNFTRFFLVVVFSALVFILQRRPNLWNWRQPAVAQANVAAPDPVANPAPAAQPAEDRAEQPGVPNLNTPDEVNNEVNSPEVQAGSPDDNPVELVPAAQEAARINPRDVTWTFLTTFFTSLIPEIPQN